MFIRSTALALTLMTVAGTAYAHHDTNHGVEDEHAPIIGPVLDASAPDITAVTADGNALNLSAVSGSKGTIVSFVRSADWCPFCKRQLIELNGEADSLLERGWQIVGLSYDTPDKLETFANKSNISFPLLSDTGSETIKAFGLLNEEVEETSRSYGIPHPALVFIGADGNVKAVLREEGYRDRPSIEAIKETIAALDESTS